ncbi:P1 family peptidase [Bradyrhizobium sp. USDA 4486]
MGNAPANSTIGMVVTGAALTKAQMKRVAIMAQDGFALSLRPAHAPMDGDIVFAATTGRAARTPELADLTEIGMMAAECLARAIARGIYEATPLTVWRRPAGVRFIHRRALEAPEAIRAAKLSMNGRTEQRHQIFERHTSARES